MIMQYYSQPPEVLR